MADNVPVLKVRSLMSRPEPITIGPEASIREAAKKMADERVGFLVVVDEDKNILGVISERDIINAIGHGKLDAKVGDIMKTNVITVHEYDSIYKAARLLKENNIRHLVVVDDEGRLKGVISIKDVAYGEGAIFSVIF